MGNVLDFNIKAKEEIHVESELGVVISKEGKYVVITSCGLRLTSSIRDCTIFNSKRSAYNMCQFLNINVCSTEVVKFLKDIELETYYKVVSSTGKFLRYSETGVILYSDVNSIGTKYDTKTEALHISNLIRGSKVEAFYRIFNKHKFEKHEKHIIMSRRLRI